MSVANCILEKANQNLVNATKAKALADKFNAEVDELMQVGGMGKVEAERSLAERLPQDLKREKLRKKRMSLKQAATHQSIIADVEGAKANGIGVDRALYARFSQDPRESITGIPDLSSRIQTVRGRIQKEFTDFLQEFRSTAAGLKRDLTELPDVVRELYGQTTGNAAAKQIAEGVKKAQDYSRARYNAAGGDIAERADYGLAISHDQTRVARASKDEWVSYVRGLVDSKRMLLPNGRPLTEEQVDVALRHAYDTVATGGLVDIAADNAGTKLFGSSVNARAASRFLAFKDADSWVKYHERFGEGNVHDHVIGTFDKLARDIATLEIMGPHPEATLRFMENQLDAAQAADALSKTGKAAAKAAGKIGAPKARLKALYNATTGKTALAANGPVAAVSQANRNVLVSATLGSAFFSALADMPLMAMAARVNGMPVMRTLGQHVKMFATNSTADRRLATRLGFTAQGWADKAIAAQRVMGESVGPEWTEKLTDTVLRATLLSPWTESGRYAFQMEMLGHITEQTGKSFEKLDKATRASFERHGITSQDWELIRNTEKWKDDETGATFLRAEDVAGEEFGTPRFEAANKLQQAIFNETSYAIITTNPRVLATLTAGAEAGTFWGEVMRNTALFKGFPLTIIHQHFGRFMAQQGSLKKAEYAAALMLGMTAVGGLTEQMNHIASGREPADMSPGSEEGNRFAMRALMRGGSTGLFGDLVFNDANRWGGGLWSGLLGPVANQTEGAYKLTVGNIQQLATGQDTNAGRELSKFIQSNTPGRSAWYAKLALERVVFDQLDKALDPNYRKSFRSVESKAKEDFNQRFWWRPGELTPQ